MGMTIDESISELSKARDSIEPILFIDQALDQSMKTAINTMRKYQKIQEIMDSRPDDDAKSNSKALGEIEVIIYGNND